MVDKVCEILQNDNLFLTGGAGVGKSYVTQHVSKKLLNSGKNVILLGSTGVSAVAIGGVTVHSFFVFGISSSLEELEMNDKKSRHRLLELKKIIEATDIIIIDEISMVSANLLDMIYYRLQNMNFHGKVMFVGDFFQLSPVVRYKENVTLFDELLFAFESSSWENLAPITLELTQMHRTKDREFADILSYIRRGYVDEKITNYLQILWQNKIPNEATYLFGKNEDVEKLNRKMLDQLPSQSISLLCETISQKGVHEKRVESWQKSLPIQELLTLKVGAPVLFCVNKWGKYANGERGIVREINNEAIVVEKEGSLVRVEPHTFELSEFYVDSDSKVKSKTLATLSQFPLKLAYAITIHKAQGMSIDNLVCNIDHIFTPSQFYVALSRATNPMQLKIDYNRGELKNYLYKIISVDNRVKEFYELL